MKMFSLWAVRRQNCGIITEEARGTDYRCQKSWESRHLLPLTASKLLCCQSHRIITLNKSWRCALLRFHVCPVRGCHNKTEEERVKGKGTAKATSDFLSDL
ncbi:hypothetical protein RRG08_054399 [Elysia crispata]|uniref:Uncharacterized protein n=1 Tax=Elysia crispata TaxID=231223 RepID=A0AAE1EAW0_9GAST|nr:hypothetical protein RRG08_054399 [Elysia crispata]